MKFVFLQSNTIEMNAELVFEHIVDSIEEYVHINDLKSVILEVDGGVNSTVCAVACYEAQQNGDFHFFPVAFDFDGRTLTKEGSVARTIGNVTSENFRVVNLSASYANVLEEIDKYYIEKDANHSPDCEFSPERRMYKCKRNITRGLRANYLSSLSLLERSLILETNCYTDIFLGAESLDLGQRSVNLFGRLWKTEVHALAAYLIKKYKKLSRKNMKDNSASLSYANIVDALRLSVSLDNKGESNAPDAMLRQKGYTREAIDQTMVYFKYFKYTTEEVIERCGEEIVNDFTKCYKLNNKQIAKGHLVANMRVPKFETLEVRSHPLYERYFYENIDENPSWMEKGDFTLAPKP